MNANAVTLLTMMEVLNMTGPAPVDFDRTRRIAPRYDPQPTKKHFDRTRTKKARKQAKESRRINRKGKRK